MTNTNATSFRKNAFEYFNQAVVFGDVINVNTKNGNAVVMSEADYRGLMETLYLKSVPGMTESILSAGREPEEECTVYDPAEEW